MHENNQSKFTGIISELRENIGRIEWDLPNIANEELKKSKEEELKREREQLSIIQGIEKEAKT